MGIRRLEQQVLHLRGQNVPFSKIAKDLGISKAYSVKLAGGQQGRSPEVTDQPSGHSRLNVRERRFARGLVDGKSQRQAALDAAEPGQLTPGSADAWANRTLGNDSFANEFRKILAGEGLTEQEIARVHRENLSATKVVGWDEDADGHRSPVTHPDYASRQRAVDKGWDLYGRGRHAGNDEGEGPHARIIVMSVEDLARTERMLGAPLDRNLIEIRGESIDEPEDQGGAAQGNEENQPVTESVTA